MGGHCDVATHRGLVQRTAGSCRQTILLGAEPPTFKRLRDATGSDRPGDGAPKHFRPPARTSRKRRTLHPRLLDDPAPSVRRRDFAVSFASRAKDDDTGTREPVAAGEFRLPKRPASILSARSRFHTGSRLRPRSKIPSPSRSHQSSRFAGSNPGSGARGYPFASRRDVSATESRCLRTGPPRAIAPRRHRRTTICRIATSSPAAPSPAARCHRRPGRLPACGKLGH